jgi:hypothetical protein
MSCSKGNVALNTKTQSEADAPDEPQRDPWFNPFA